MIWRRRRRLKSKGFTEGNLQALLLVISAGQLSLVRTSIGALQFPGRERGLVRSHLIQRSVHADCIVRFGEAWRSVLRARA